VTRFLLDTNALIFAAESDERFDRLGRPALERSLAEGGPLVVSAISAWEVALKASKGKLSFVDDPAVWFEAATPAPTFRVEPITVDVLIASVALQGLETDDPADRILVFLARRDGLTLVTRDAKILAYAEAGHLSALPC
jgi:PIN domain nuclease of toxin-antitoxin system